MSDWPTQAADTIERAVETVRERGVEPTQRATRSVVAGVVVALVALPALVLLSFALFRGLVELLQEEVWAAWLVLGGIYVAAGAVLWARRTA